MNIALFGKILLVIGAAVMLTGAALMVFGGIPLIGKLPGDFVVKKENFTLFIPIGTSIAISVIFSLILLILNLIKK